MVARELFHFKLIRCYQLPGTHIIHWANTVPLPANTHNGNCAISSLGLQNVPLQNLLGQQEGKNNPLLVRLSVNQQVLFYKWCNRRIISDFPIFPDDATCKNGALQPAIMQHNGGSEKPVGDGSCFKCHFSSKTMAIKSEGFCSTPRNSSQSKSTKVGEII